MLRLVETDSNMGLGREVIDLVGIDLGEQGDKSRAVAQVAIMQEQLGVLVMRINIEMIDPRGVECGCSPDESVDLISLMQQQFSEV